MHQGFHFSSCVGRVDYLKGKIDDKTYNFLFDIFKLNYERILDNQDEDIPDEIIKEIREVFK